MTKGSADIAPTSQPSRSGVLRPSTAMRWCGPIANAKTKPVIIGVYRRVSGISLRPELHLIGCPVRTGRASARARVSCHSSVASVPIVMEFSNASLLPWPQDAETKDQVWVAASSEKEARRSVALYHEPDCPRS